MITNGHGVPVVALDIDGTLGDYHGNFMTFASWYFDVDYTLLLGRENPGLPLWQFMQLDPRDYREAKLAYRQGGWKRWMPVYPWAAELTYAIRHEAGAEVWICTTRPYLRLDNIDPDTREWLRRNGIEYDAVLFDRLDEKHSKYRELWRQAGSRVAAILEDLPELIEEAQRLRIPHLSSAILRDQPYNRYLLDYPRRVANLQEAWHLIKSDLDLWREHNGQQPVHPEIGSPAGSGEDHHPGSQQVLR